MDKILKKYALYLLPSFSHNTVVSEQTGKRVLSSVKCYTLDFSMQTMVIIRVVLFLMYLCSFIAPRVPVLQENEPMSQSSRN